MERLKVVTLNSFSVMKGEENLSVKYKRSKKIWQLLQCLLANKGKVVSADYLTECICPEDDVSNPKQVMQNLVYRLRRILDEENTKNEDSVIVFEHEGYRWNTKDHFFDAQRFEELCVIGFKRGDDAICCFEKALNLYKNQFLIDNNENEYVQTARMYYHDLYQKANHTLIHLYQLQGRYDDIIEIAKSALLIDYYDTDIHKEYLNALIEKDQIRKALSHYEEATERLYIQAGILPTAEMNAIYRSIKNKKKEGLFVLSDILKDLSAKYDARSACLCDHETISFMYNIFRKRKERLLNSVNEMDDHSLRVCSAYIMLLTVVPTDAHKSSAPADTVMRQMTEVLLKTLRRTDMVCLFSQSQFLILLFDLDMDHTDKVFNRIKNEYERAHPDTPAVLLKNINAI